MTRRIFLARAGGLTLTMGASCSWRVQRKDPYEAGMWLAGDHHVHTRYSIDGQYLIREQVENAARHGLHWCVITDHGGVRHDKVLMERAYPDLVAARRDYPNILVYQGLEWNIPAGEHCSVILPPTRDEAQKIADFEVLFDEKNISRNDTPADTEADALEGIRYLQKLTPRPIMIANHPARQGFDSPHEMRAWADAGPDVMRGFEASPGHHASVYLRIPRGWYSLNSTPESFAGYPPESYRTWGGYDWYVAKVGGVWDSLLGEGRAWFITTNSDSHRHHKDLTEVDLASFPRYGFVTPTSAQYSESKNYDFHPGEYNKTWVYSSSRNAFAVLDGIRSGNMFTTLGNLVDAVELTARADQRIAPMGGAVQLERSAQDVVVRLRVRVPSGSVGLHHVDIIAGNITGPAADKDSIANTTTKVVARIKSSDAQGEGAHRVFEHKFSKVTESFYVRVRGTNTAVDEPQMDTLKVDPWRDLWFYSNPVFVRVPGA